MSFRELTMIDVKEVLRRCQAGQSARQMAREGVVGRRTATRYIEAATELGLTPESELVEEMVRAVARRIQERPVTEPSEVRRVLDAHRARIEQRLEHDPPLTLVRVQELLARDGVSISYTTLRRYARHVGIYAERLLAGPLPWTRMRQAYGCLLRLCERYGASRVDALCARALAFDVIDVPRIERMLKAARTAEDSAPAGRIVPLPASRFARDPASFATIKSSRKGGT